MTKIYMEQVYSMDLENDVRTTKRGPRNASALGPGHCTWPQTVSSSLIGSTSAAFGQLENMCQTKLID